MTYFKNLALLLATSLPFALGAGCTTDNTSSTAQLIECTDTGSGTTGCHAVSQDDHAAGTCVDRDEDGDGEAHDANDDHGGSASANGSSTDDDGDGTADADDADDDNDGVDDDRDCDERHGGDDDDSGDSTTP